MWPIDDSTMKSRPRIPAMVLALAGDSTMTRGLGISLSRLGALPPECQTVGKVKDRLRCRYRGFPVDPRHLLETFGTLGLIGIIFAETGLLVGFFLPGDSLLVTAGLLASQGKLNIAAILVGTSIAAVVGAQVGFFIGERIGPTLFRRPDSRLFK